MMREKQSYMALARTKDRLREPLQWFPYPAIITFGLVLIFTGHLVFATSPRMGSPANIINFSATPEKNEAVWLSVTPIEDEIVITTGDRKVFRWPQNVTNIDSLKPFIDHLKQRVAKEIEAAVLQKETSKYQLSTVIAADQRLKFRHMRPVIYALAAAGISNYAFETINLAQETSSPTPHELH